MLSRLQDYAAQYRAGRLTAAAFAARYFLCWQIARHGSAFAARKRRGDARPDVAQWSAALDDAAAPLLKWFDRYQFRGVSDGALTALGGWLRGAWPLVLTEHVPSAFEVLRAQAGGSRPVTVITAPDRMQGPVLHKPDAFAFFLHDLEHACKFFHAPSLYAGQRAFFAALDVAIADGTFAECFDEDECRAKLHYVMSDMNTHPEHARQYLRAVLIQFYLKREAKPSSASLSPLAERAIDGMMRDLERRGAPVLAAGVS